jgi:ferrochelatase
VKAVVLFNLGGPTSPESVEPFLYNLFSDPDIIRLPRMLRFLQKPLASRISRKRGPEARKNYALIGGRSPLLENTKKQADALAQELGSGYRVFIAMRYWEPLASDTVAALKEANPDEVVFLPLYPQFSISTTASSRNDFVNAMEAAEYKPPVKQIEQWYDKPGFADLVAQSLREVMQHVEPEQAHILFSAHGVPVSYVTKYGDPYQKQIEETVAAVMAAPCEVARSGYRSGNRSARPVGEKDADRVPHQLRLRTH